MDASTTTKMRMGRTVFSNVLTKQLMINNGSYLSAAKLTTGGQGSNETLLLQDTGGVNTLPSEFNAINGFQIKPPPPALITGSYNLAYNQFNYGYLTVNNSPDFSFGTGDFTVEWFQYFKSPHNEYPRIFSLGSYSDAVTMGASIEQNSIFYFWMNNFTIFGVSISIENKWAHMAVTRHNGYVTAYLDGIPISSPVLNQSNLVDTIHNLVIGNESDSSALASFAGYITNFRMVKGRALYTSNFTPPNKSLLEVPGTVLLLSAVNSDNLTLDSSDKHRVISNTNVTWSAASPFNYSS